MQGARSRSLLPAGSQQSTDALQTKLCIFSYMPFQTCLPCCRARCGAGFSLLHGTLSQPQHSSQATWQPSRQESSQLRSQELPGCSDRETSLVDPGSSAASEGTCGGSSSQVQPKNWGGGSCPPQLPVSCLLCGLVSDPSYLCGAAQWPLMHFLRVLHPKQLPHTLTQEPLHPSSTSVSSAPPSHSDVGAHVLRGSKAETPWEFCIATSLSPSLPSLARVRPADLCAATVSSDHRWTVPEI